MVSSIPGNTLHVCSNAVIVGGRAYSDGPGPELPLCAIKRLLAGLLFDLTQIE